MQAAILFGVREGKSEDLVTVTFVERGEFFMPLFLVLLCQGRLRRPPMRARLIFLLCLPEGGGVSPSRSMLSHQAFSCLGIRLCGKGGEMDVTDWFCCGNEPGIKGSLFDVLRV